MRAGLTTAAAVVALALAACGGDGDDEAEDQFLAEANAVCADYGPKLELIPPPAQDVDEWAAIGADMADLLEASVNELRLLVPPDGLADDFGEWLALRTEMATAMRDVQAAGGLHDEPAVASGLAQVNDAMAVADPLAEQIGLVDCAPTGIDSGGELPDE